MSASGESVKEHIKPNFNRSITLDFQGAKLPSDSGFLLLRELDQRHGMIARIGGALEDGRSAHHAKHTLVQMIRQRVYQMAADYEDCNDADFLRIDPALRLSLDKGHQHGAGQSALSRLENVILGNAQGLKSLDEAVLRSADALIHKKDKYRFIRLSTNETLRKTMEPEITKRPVGRPPNSSVKVQYFEFYYRAGRR
jgi:hypothetical protein